VPPAFVLHVVSISADPNYRTGTMLSNCQTNASKQLHGGIYG